MAIVWWLYGESLVEVALCSARMLVFLPCEQRELQTQSAHLHDIISVSRSFLAIVVAIVISLKMWLSS
jgi:hypothetical protein